MYRPDRPELARNLGNAHQELGEHQQARSVLDRALGIFEAVYGSDHPHTHQAGRLLARLDKDETCTEQQDDA